MYNRRNPVLDTHEIIMGMVTHTVPNEHGERTLDLDPLLEDYVLGMPEVLMVDGVPTIMGVSITFDSNTFTFPPLNRTYM